MKYVILIIGLTFATSCSKKDMANCYIYEKSTGKELYSSSDGNVEDKWNEVKSHTGTEFKGTLYGNGEVDVKCN